MKLRCRLGVILFLVANFALPQLVQAQGQWSGSFGKLNGRIIRSMTVAPFDNNLIIVGNKGKAAGDATLFVSRNGGVSWRFLNAKKSLNNQATDVQAVAAVNGNIFLAGTWKHGLFRSSDSGASFKPVNAFPSKDVRGFAVTQSGVVFAASGNKGVLRSADAGVTWTQTSLNKAFIWSVHADRTGTTLLASSPTGGLYRSTDQGNSWNKILENKTNQAVAGDNSGFIAAATENGLFISRDAAASWAAIEPFKNQRLSSVKFKNGNPDVLLIGGWTNGLWEYSISQQKAVQIGASLPVVHVAETGNGVVVGSWGKGLRIHPHSKNTAYLINATLAKDAGTVTQLLNAGATPDVYDGGRNTPLIYASRDGSTAIAKSLIEKGADVNWIDGENVTPLILASFKNHPQIVEMLLARGADKGVVDKFGRKAIDYAKERGKEDSILKILNSR